MFTCDICGKEISKTCYEKLNGLCYECANKNVDDELNSEDRFWNSYEK